MYFCIISEAQTLMKLAEIEEAMALASSVFPVPGGPYSRTPLAGGTPTFWNNAGFIRGSSMTSLKEASWEDKPPMEE